MKLPLLGIAVIVVLQLGFTAYNALDRPITSLAHVKALRTAANPVADLSDGWTSDTSQTANVYARARTTKNYLANGTAKPRKASRTSNPSVVFAITVIKIPEAKPDQAMLQFIAMHKTSNAVVTKYPQPMRSSGESDNYYVQADRSTEKRSFASKSASVLKKPYVWIKAIGSKLK